MNARRPRAVANVTAKLLALALVFGARTARSQAAAPDRVAAQTLFDEGLALRDAGEGEAACEKFAASLRLEQAVGTLLNVAACEEGRGRLATAWLRFREAESLAASRADDRSKVAASGAAQLAARVGYLRIDMPRGVSLSVLRDGVLVDPALDGTSVPVDAGPHTLEASAAGRRAWRSVIETKDGETALVTIPELELDPALAADVAPRPRDAPRASASSPRVSTAAVVVGSVGLGSLVAGGIFGVLTITKNASANDACSAAKNTSAPSSDFDPRTGRCYAPSAPLEQATAMKDEARTFANLANVLVPVGLLGVGLGVYLVLRSSPPGGATVRVAPSLTGASLEGRF